MDVQDRSSTIGIIGGGMSGLTAAYILSRKYDVTILESTSSTLKTTYSSPAITTLNPKIDLVSDFLYLNDCHCGVLHNLLSQLHIPVEWCDMSSSYYNRRNGNFYADKNIFSLLSTSQSLTSKELFSHLSEIIRFGKKGVVHLENVNASNTESLAQFLQANNFSNEFIESYVTPLCSLFSSVPYDGVEFLPATYVFSLLRTYGLLGITQTPRWLKFTENKSTLIKKCRELLADNILDNFEVVQVVRSPQGVIVRSKNSDEKVFDEIVFACHADSILTVLEQPSPQEIEVFSHWKYHEQSIILHTDETIMPPKKVSWATRNFTFIDPTSRPILTYYLNALHRTELNSNYFISVCDEQTISQDKIIQKTIQLSPIFDQHALATQKKLHELQGKQKTYYCGSYFGYGLHEDAARSGAQVGLYKGLVL